MKRFICALISLVLIFSLCACGSSSDYSKSAATEAAYDSGYYYSNDSVAVMTEEAYEEELTYGGLASDENSAAASGSSSGDINVEKIIYSANAQLETTTYDETISALNALIETYGGFIESSSINGANYYNTSRGYTYNRSAYYTIRIPSVNFQTVMTSLSTLGNVPYTNTYTENITTQYYDVQARLTAYQTQETRLIEMLAAAETVEDIITIEDRLTEVRYQIDSLQSKLNNWDRSVSYSTIYLDVNEVTEYTPVAAVNPTYGERLVSAAKNGLIAVADFFKDFLLWLAEALPTLIILAVIVIIIIVIARKSRKKYGATRAERRAKRDAERLARKEARMNGQSCSSENKDN